MADVLHHVVMTQRSRGNKVLTCVGLYDEVDLGEDHKDGLVLLGLKVVHDCHGEVLPVRAHVEDDGAGRTVEVLQPRPVGALGKVGAHLARGEGTVAHPHTAKPRAALPLHCDHCVWGKVTQLSTRADGSRNNKKTYKLTEIK